MIFQTHALAGILIQICCFKIFVFPFDIIFSILFAFLSHFIIDALVLITYHPPDPQKGDMFWLVWQILTYGSGAIIIILFLPYVIGMLFANLVDIIDWVILRNIHTRKFKDEEKDWGKNYFFHSIIAKIREKALFWLPNWIYEKKAIISEIIIDIILIIGIIYLLA